MTRVRFGKNWVETITGRIRFQLDEHVPRAVADGLRRRGVDVVTAHEAATLGLADEGVLARAHDEERVLVTADDDFLGLHEQGQPHRGIAYYVHHRHSIGAIVTGLVLIHEVLEPHELAGRVEYL